MPPRLFERLGMSLRIITISDQFADHWEYAKKNGFWDLMFRPQHLSLGDDVLFRTTGAEGSFVGRAVVAGSPHELSENHAHAWSERDERQYKYRVPLHRLEDLDPIRVTWSELMALGAPKRLTSVTRIPDEIRMSVESRLGLGDAAYVKAVEILSRGEDPLVEIGTDTRERVPASVVVRRGQAQFRMALLKAYRSQCAVTGTAFEPLLEAAHIAPYRGRHTHLVRNGLLLRSDIPTHSSISAS